MLYREYGKRLVDVIVSACALVVVSPIIAAAALTIGVSMGRPILFRQERSGRGGETFEVLKLRTMRVAERDDVPDGERITAVGRWMRRWSVDELPQLWNVMRGEMSLIGPRPLLPRYEPYYRAAERSRFAVRPGITGWAQVNGRNDSSWDTRLAHDAWYVEHLSFGLDLRIAVLTVQRLLTGHGIQVDPRSSLEDLDRARARQGISD